MGKGAGRHPPSRNNKFIFIMEEKSISKTKVRKEISYYYLYLKKILTEGGDARARDEAFMDERSSMAEEDFESARLEGLTVDQAQERAIAVLTQGL